MPMVHGGKVATSSCGAGGESFAVVLVPQKSSVPPNRRLTTERDFPVPSPPRGGCRQRVPRWEVQFSHQLARKGKSMTILYVGIDLAKNIFALHGVAAGGAVVLRQPRVARAKLHEQIGRAHV